MLYDQPCNFGLQKSTDTKFSHLKVETHEVNTHKSVHVTCAAGDGVLGNIKATGAHVQPKCNEVEVRFCA